MCYFCNQKLQKKIWSSLKRWLSYLLRVNIEFNREIAILNDYTGTCADLIKTIILITKQYIYATKYLKKDLIFINLAQSIYDMKTLYINQYPIVSIMS